MVSFQQFTLVMIRAVEENAVSFEQLAAMSVKQTLAVSRKRRNTEAYI
jgi:hypothetical protein